MSQVNRTEIVNALKTVEAPGGGSDVVSAGMVSSIVIRDGNIGFVLENSDPAAGELVRRRCEKAVAAIPGVKKVTAVLTAEARQSHSSIRVAPASAPKSGTRPPQPKSLPGVKHILAVASGKGGVGKSTVAVNLAATFARLEQKTGLVDADIYGPSVARMMGVDHKPEMEDNLMLPVERAGVKCLSMGMILDEDMPVVWRGPMISKALQQLTFGARWAPLDILVADLPPGTGDIHLSIVQNFTVSGAVIVSTPQQIALLDVKKAIQMYFKTGVPVLGVIENMSYFEDPASSGRNYLFGRGGVDEAIAALDIEKIGEIPLIPAISETSDAGVPFVVRYPDHPVTDHYREIAERLLAKIMK